MGTALILLTFFIALAFRIPYLDLRPFHGDEANQAFKAGILMEKGEYRYDPVEHHGPTIYYLAQPFAWLTAGGRFADTTEATYRIVPVLFGSAVVLLLLSVRGALGDRATFITALLTAISPAMVFYSRYYIQEMLLCFFAFGAIAAGWRYTRRPSFVSAASGGLCIGLAHASKETCILAFGAYLGAGACTAGWARLRDGRSEIFSRPKRTNVRHAVLGIAVAVAVSVVFFSSFFSHWRGVADSLLTYANYTSKAGSSHIHDKPWYYYLQLLAFTKHAPYPWFSEGLILVLGAIGIRVALTAKKSADMPGVDLLRFLAFYTLLMIAAYSLIPYKTPWCAINFLQPLIVMAGIGADALIRGLPARVWRVGAAAVIALFTLQLSRQACLANFQYYADIRNPYVYAHTSIAIKQLNERTEQIAAVAPEGHDMLVGVVQPRRDYWPLPWYLRKFNRVGYWDELPAGTSPLYSASMIIASPDVAEVLHKKLNAEYETETDALRPGVLLVVFIRKDLWDAFIATREAPAR